MNAKVNSIRIVPALITTERIQGLDKPIASAALLRAVLAEDVVPLADTRLLLALPSTDHRAGEFWETLSYVAIWLSGWIGIGLCFLCKAGTMQ